MSRTAILAARRPLALMILAAAIFSGLTIALWLLPLGLVVYVAYVFLSVSDPQLAAQAAAPQRPGRLSRDVDRQIDQIERSSDQIREVVAGAIGPLQRLLQPIVQQTNELVEHAYGLAAKGSVIDKSLSATNPTTLRQQLVQCDGQLAATSDPYVRQQLEERRQALIEQEQNLAALATYRDRILAQLANLSANLDKVYTDTLRLKAAQATDVTSESGQIADQLRNLNSDVDSFQKVLETNIGSM